MPSCIERVGTLATKVRRQVGRQRYSSDSAAALGESGHCARF